MSAPSSAAPPLSAILTALVAVVIWGGSSVATKAAVGVLEPATVALMRTVLAGAAAVLLIPALRLAPPKGARPRLLLLLSAFCGFIGFPLIFSIGQRLTSAMHGGLILAALPLFTGLYAAAFERRLPSRRWAVGCAVALAGEAALITFRTGPAAAAGSIAGDGLVLLSALLASLGYVAGGRLAQTGYSSRGATFWGVLLAGAAVLPAALLRGDLGAVVAHGAMPLLCVLFLAIGVSILGYIAWYWALAKGGIARIGLLQFLQPVSGLALAALLLGEQLTLPLLLAAICILGGVIIAQRAR
ncbi:MAG: DMT family transporter [Dongiaceae bacterium]